MLEVTTLGWTLTIAVIVALLALDLTLGVFRPHAVGFREATAWSIFYIAVAVVFGFVFAGIAGWDFGTQYFAGYIVEKSLSVDNLFVFVIIMSTFAVPEVGQLVHRAPVQRLGGPRVELRRPARRGGVLPEVAQERQPVRGEPGADDEHALVAQRAQPPPDGQQLVRLQRGQ